MNFLNEAHLLSSFIFLPRSFEEAPKIEYNTQCLLLCTEIFSKRRKIFTVKCRGTRVIAEGKGGRSLTAAADISRVPPSAMFSVRWAGFGEGRGGNECGQTLKRWFSAKNWS